MKYLVKHDKSNMLWNKLDDQRYYQRYYQLYNKLSTKLYDKLYSKLGRILRNP